MDLCMSCSNPVRPRQEGLQCDGCNRWQHRTCHTGISRETYRAAVQSGQTIDWFCDQCNQPVAESTRLDEDLEIVPQSSKRGRPKLIDNRGYTFGFQRQRGSTTDWQCVVRPKNNPCKAKVRQKENRFEPGLHCHNHPASVGATTTAKVIASVKAKAVEDLFKPASATVDEVCFHLFNENNDECE